MDNSSNSEKRCSNCSHWSTNERITEKYDEGWGYCSRNKDHFFCDHCCICFTDESETKSIKEEAGDL